MKLRSFAPNDWDQAWAMIEPVFRAGESFPCSPTTSKDEAYRYWVEAPRATYVAVDDADKLLGIYYIKPNQPTLGAHVCNCGYIVAETARGQGVASAMCEHSQAQAVILGFKAMQYNLVVCANEAAVHVWQKNGLEIVATLPGAFQHARLGLVDAYIMYKVLDGA